MNYIDDALYADMIHLIGAHIMIQEIDKEKYPNLYNVVQAAQKANAQQRERGVTYDDMLAGRGPEWLAQFKEQIDEREAENSVSRD